MNVRASGLVQFELNPLIRHARRHTAELRLLNSHCAHRKLAAIKTVVDREGRSTFGIKEIGFPTKNSKMGGLLKRDVHLLVIETNVLACSGMTVEEALEVLSRALASVITRVVQDVDQNVVDQKVVAPLIVRTRTAKANNTSGNRKQKRRELHLIRRQREEAKQKRSFTVAALRDNSELPLLG